MDRLTEKLPELWAVLSRGSCRGPTVLDNVGLAPLNTMAGAVTLGNVASAIGVNAEEASLVTELKAGSEEAYDWLIARFHQQIGRAHV